MEEEKVCPHGGAREKIMRSEGFIISRAGSPELLTFNPLSPCVSVLLSAASAYANLQQQQPESIHRKLSPVSSYVPQSDYLERDEEDDLIKPKKLQNPVKASKSHQELHRELMSSCKW